MQYEDNYEVVKYDHARVRSAMNYSFRKYPEEERYPRMVASVEEMLRRATERGAVHAMKYQTDCLNALKKDKR